MNISHNIKDQKELKPHNNYINLFLFIFKYKECYRIAQIFVKLGRNQGDDVV